MPRICFKTRPGGTTAQLVRDVYCPHKKRSRTETVGSVRLAADPDALPEGVRLKAGLTLSESEYEGIRRWLCEHGDPVAAQRRQELREEIEVRVRESMTSATARSPESAFARVTEALADLAEALPGLAATANEAGVTPWERFRAEYLAANSAWQGMVVAAQAAGIAKQVQRTRST